MKLALRLILCFFIAFSTASAAFAAPSIRDQAIGISKELRDPGAVNQSLYESNAPQAAELKAKIYQLLENGQTREDILDYFAARYGKQIRYDPPVLDLCALGGSRRTFFRIAADSIIPHPQT